MKVLKYILLLIGLLCASPTYLNAQANLLWQDLGLYGGQINRIAIDPVNSSHLYAGSWLGDGFFASKDGGKSWVIGAENAGWFRTHGVYGIDIDPNNPQNIWVANNQFVDVSYDYGLTWKTFYFADEEGRICCTVKVDPHDVTGNTVYVGTSGPNGTDDLGVLYKTTDGGNTWHNLEGNFPPDYQPFNIWDIDVNPARPDEIWATSRKRDLSPEGRIFMSMDGGNQWSAWDTALWNDGTVKFLSSPDEILVHPEKPDLIFAADWYGILRKQDSTNTATRWSWVTDKGGSLALCIAPAYPYTLYAGFVNSIGKSTDDGTSWNYYDRPGMFLSLAATPDNPDILFGGDMNQGVFKSSDGAQTWQPKNNGIRANMVFATDVSPASTDMLVAGTVSGVYRQIGGTQWEQKNKSSAFAVRFHPVNENTIFAGFEGYLGKSTDNGATWTYTDISDSEEGHRAVSIAVAKSNPDIICAGISFDSGKRGEVIKSTDGGTTYSMVWETTVPVNTIKIHPTNPQIVFAGTGYFYAPVAPANIYKSTDGGKTFVPASSQKLVVNSIAIAAANPDLIYIGCGANDNCYTGIYKSTDAGKTWELKIKGLPKKKDGTPAFAVTSVKIDDTNPDIVYASLFQDGIYVTMNGGNYWTCAGLSDYLSFDVNSVQNSAAHSANGAVQKSSLLNLPTATILAGTASGMFKCSSSGIGLLSGTITAKDTGGTIDNAAVSSSSGSSCASSEGFYSLMMPAGVHDIEVAADGYDNASLFGITVNAGEMVTRDITLSTGNGDDDGGCVATSLLKNRADKKQLPMLRTFRDAVLIKSPAGNRLVSLYYAAGSDAWNVLKNNQQLRERSVKLLRDALPAVLSSLRTKSLSIPSSLLNEASCFLFDLEQVSPARLKTQINKFRREMKQENLLSFAHPR